LESARRYIATRGARISFAVADTRGAKAGFAVNPRYRAPAWPRAMAMAMAMVALLNRLDRAPTRKERTCERRRRARHLRRGARPPRPS